LRVQKWQILIFLSAIILGILIMAQLQMQQKINLGREIIRDRNIALSELLERAEEGREQQEEEIQSLRRVIAIYERMATDNEILTPGVSGDLDNLRILTGRADVVGPGIIAELEYSGTRNNTVSSSDLQDIVNILRYAGAEAISINDQRIIYSTPISEAGSNMLINKIPVSGLDEIHYEIKAIGDPERLEDMLLITDNLMPNLVDYKGVSFSINQEENIEIPAYLGSVVFEHADAVPQQ